MSFFRNSKTIVTFRMAEIVLSIISLALIASSKQHQHERTNLRPPTGSGNSGHYLVSHTRAISQQDLQAERSMLSISAAIAFLFTLSVAGFDLISHARKNKIPARAWFVVIDVLAMALWIVTLALEVRPGGHDYLNRYSDSPTRVTWALAVNIAVVEIVLFLVSTASTYLSAKAINTVPTDTKTIDLA